MIKKLFFREGIVNRASASRSDSAKRVSMPLFAAGSVMLVLLILWWLAGSWYHQVLLNDRRAELDDRLDYFTGVLMAEIDSRISEIESLAVLVQNSEEVTEAEFISYFDDVESGVEQILLYALSPEATYRYEYPPGASVNISGSDPRLTDDPEVRAAIQRTIDSREVAIEVHEVSGQNLHLDVWLAIYKGGSFFGLAQNEYHLSAFIEEAGLGSDTDDIDLVVRGNRGEVVLESSADELESPVVKAVPVADGNWEIAGAPVDGWEDSLGLEFDLFRGGGLAIAMLLSFIVYLLAGRQASLRQAVLERTSELEESRQHYQALFDASPDAMFVIDSSGRISDSNTVAIERYGYSLEQLRKMPVRELTAPGLREQVSGKVAEALAGGASFEWVHASSDGTEFPVEINARPIEIAGKRFIISSARDISERKVAEAALSASEEKFRTLFEESRDVVFISTPAGSFTDINPAALGTFGYASRDELLALDLRRDLYEDPGVRDEFQQRMAEHGYVKDFEARLKRRDGQPLDVLISATAHRDGDGNVVAYRGIIRDVTEQRRLSEQLVQAQKMESVGHLAGGIAHDFNNLLTVIKGNVDLARMTVDGDGPAVAELDDAAKAVDRATTLTRQMLLFSRRESADVVVVDINTVITDLLKMLRRLIGEGYRLTTIFDDDRSLASVDIANFEQVILNLVVNARDSMPGGGEIIIMANKVRIDEGYASRPVDAYPGDFVRISVIDSGVGIDAETRKRIFEPFFSTKEVGKGTGLGLAVAYGIVASLKGWIAVESVVGQGSTFSVYLPAAVSSQVAAPRGVAAEESLSGENKLILLVEDEKLVRDIDERILTTHGYRVVMVEDAESALEVFRERGDDIELVFSDVVLPGEDGFSLAEKLKAERPGLKVLLASGYVNDKILANISDTDTPLLQKPYSVKKLLNAVQAMLTRQDS
ncbi:MAG: hybrid sensor histidine kinase/response regulator [Thermoleophilia bacterium]